MNLSKEQQRKRFLRRIDLPDHNWKFSTADVRERERSDDFQVAFSEALSYTSTEWAPWHVILGDHRDRHRRVRRVGACPRGRRVGTNLTSPGPLVGVARSGRHPDECRLS